MPVLFPSRQPASTAAWFDGDAGRAVLASQEAAVREALLERPALPWLWLAPRQPPEAPPGRGILMLHAGDHWNGDLRCAWPLPVLGDSIATVVLQHVTELEPDIETLLEESARVLVPGGALWLLALNPLSPYRRHWSGCGLACAEPVSWRRRLRAAGLEPESVALGIGPRWHQVPSPERQHGAGLRAAFVLQARKRVAAFVQPTPVPALAWQPGLSAT